MIRPRLVVVFMALFALTGCVTHYVPTASRPLEPIAEFTSNHTISLQNGQPLTEPVTTARHPITGAKTMDANLKAWTDTALEITARELKARSMTVGSGATKTLTLAITQATTEVGWVQIETRIVMKVDTSDGYTATYTGINSAAMAAIPSRQIDGAMMRVVREMLMDPRIVNYLTR